MKYSHSRQRDYEYCDFHQKIEKKFNGEEMIHCAFDDVMFLAKVLLKEINVENLSEEVELIEEESSD